MDIERPDVKRKKKMRRIAYIGVALVVAVVITGALSRLKPAAPGVDKATVWPDTVKRGPMLRDVRGLGTLVPETIHVISAATDGVVKERYLLPGTTVKANTVILDLVNPQLQQQVARRGVPVEGRAGNVRADQGAAAKPVDGQADASGSDQFAIPHCRPAGSSQ